MVCSDRPLGEGIFDRGKGKIHQGFQYLPVKKSLTLCGDASMSSQSSQRSQALLFASTMGFKDAGRSLLAVCLCCRRVSAATTLRRRVKRRRRDGPLSVRPVALHLHLHLHLDRVTLFPISSPEISLFLRFIANDACFAQPSWPRRVP